MNPFVTRISRNEQWVWPISAMCLVLGFMISLAWVTEYNRSSRYQLLEAAQKGRVSEATIDVEKFAEMSTEVNKLQAEKTRLENALAGQSGNAKVLNDSLQETKSFAGLTKVQGPGVVITLRDSAKGGMKVGDQMVFTPDTNIHDLDVLRIVNELFSAGAEAISIGDIRLTGSSSIRCVGPTILVNDVKIASPVEIRAIGDPQVLMGGLNLNGGVLSEIRTSDPNMVSIEAIKDMTLPAFTGKTSFRLAKPVMEKPVQGSSKSK